MIKVIHLISSLNMGGAETMVKDYALLMDKNQFEVLIISLDRHYNSENEKILQEKGIPVIFLSELRYPADKKLNILQMAIRKFARYYDLYKIIKNERPNILHVHLYIGMYLRMIPIKKWGIKLFYTIHNVPERFFDASGKDREKYAMYREVKRLLKKEGLNLIVLQKGMNQQVRDLFATKRVITVNNGVNLDRFHRELYDRDVVRRTLVLPEDTLLIGHVGRFHEQKNHDFIIRVFVEVQKKNPNTHLLLVGGGPLRNQIEQQIFDLGLSEKVTILQNRSDIPELMCAMDVFIFPSRWEGFGNVMVEAQSMGLPCVVSDKIHENVIVNENVSVLSLEAPVDEWVQAILTAKIADVSDNINQYDIKNSVKKLERIYLNEEEKQ